MASDRRGGDVIIIKHLSASGVCLYALAVSSFAAATVFNIPAGDLQAALDAYATQSGIALIVSSDEVRGIHTSGVHGDLPAATALSRMLTGTGFGVFKYST